MSTLPLEELIASAGSLERVSNWLEITQEMIDQFATATNDHQFIHVDLERAKSESPFGGTIAHGFLTLSLLTTLLNDCMPRASEAEVQINYGFDKIRFLNPVLSGSQIRARFALAEVSERNFGEYLFRYTVMVEIRNSEKPALAAEWLGLTVTNQQGQIES